MPLNIIVSYDGTTHDDDALMLGRMLAASGATVSLAYVRHSREYDPRREEIAEHDAARRLQQGAMWLGDESVTRHVVVDPSTSAGLGALAASERADLVVFGSDYRTPPGRVEPGASAQGLLDNGAVAIAVAAAGLRTAFDAPIKTVSVAGEADGAAARTARSVVESLGAELFEGRRDADLILVDSRAGAPQGRVALDGSARAHLDSARGSVIVLPRDVPLTF
jgi:universal stress protein family protein